MATTCIERKNVRVAVVGSVDAGKSSAIGVLTSGKLDNGRGSARSSVFIHKHEQVSGRTSCVSRQPVGYRQATEDSKMFEPIFNSEAASAASAAKNRAWKELTDQSHHIVEFIDLAGHEKYNTTTSSGLSSGFPDCAMLMVNALSGVIKITNEHLGLLAAFNIPMFIVISKIDMAPVNILDRTKGTIKKALSLTQRKPYAVRSVEDIDRLLLEDGTNFKIWIPVIQVSFVQGTNIDLLHHLISVLKPRPLPLLSNGPIPNTESLSTTTAVTSTPLNKTLSPEGNVFSIDDTYTVEGVGFIVCGLVLRGNISINTTMWIGPLRGNDPSNVSNTASASLIKRHQLNSKYKSMVEHKYHYVEVKVRSMRQFRSSVVETVTAGNNCAIAIRAINRKYVLGRSNVYRGVCLLSDAAVSNQMPEATTWFEADITILHHATQIKVGYEVIVHLQMVRQSMRLIRIQDKGVLRDGDQAKCVFRFLQYAVHMHTGTKFVFREGLTKGVGLVTKHQWTAAEKDQLQTDEKNMLFIRTKNTD
jgi:GTPase